MGTQLIVRTTSSNWVTICKYVVKDQGMHLVSQTNNMTIYKSIIQGSLMEMSTKMNKEANIFGV